MSAILSITDLTIQRDKTTLLRDIDWQVRNGEHWVILGPNGSGKTSLLSALTGYLTPTRGEISLLGETFGETDWRELRRHVGLVSSSIRQQMPEEEPALISVISGKYAMIDYWGDIDPADIPQARRILKQVEATEFADREWRFLSQGERQRILIGRALMAQPPLLILDEPCAGIDPVAREEFMQFVERLGTGKNAPTLVLVTHHVEEITPCFSHVLMLSKGRVTAKGALQKNLTSETLSKTFNRPITLRKTQQRYALRFLTQRF